VAEDWRSREDKSESDEYFDFVKNWSFPDSPSDEQFSSSSRTDIAGDMGVEPEEKVEDSALAKELGGGFPKSGWFAFFLATFLSALLGGIGAVLVLPYILGTTPANLYLGQEGVRPRQQIIQIENDSQMTPVTAVAKKLQPSVVNIRIKQSVEVPFHEDVIGGVGSGVIYRSDGYIITNNHVVSGAKEIWVTIGTETIRGRVIARDTESDLALVKVNRRGLPAAEFGSTRKLQVGDLAVAIGSPFGFEHTVTAGIISALHRTVNIPDRDTERVKTLTDMIQTDAPINPGNSGGALSDAQGRVIGINTVIMSSSGVYEGIGFAIPVETVLRVVEQLLTKGKASHPYMGILGQNVDPEVAKKFNLPVKEGAIIVDVVKSSPAGKAGLQKYDVIIKVDQERIESMDELIAEIRKRKVGDRINVTFLRKRIKKNITLRLVEKPRFRE
jgi:serine protease Do